MIYLITILNEYPQWKNGLLATNTIKLYKGPSFLRLRNHLERKKVFDEGFPFEDLFLVFGQLPSHDVIIGGETYPFSIWFLLQIRLPHLFVLDRTRGCFQYPRPSLSS
jgi:hypothetical protein